MIPERVHVGGESHIIPDLKEFLNADFINAIVVKSVVFVNGHLKEA